MLQGMSDQQLSQMHETGFPVRQSALQSKLLLSSVNFVNKADPLVIKLKIGSTPVDISIG